MHIQYPHAQPYMDYEAFVALPEHTLSVSKMRPDSKIRIAVAGNNSSSSVALTPRMAQQLIQMLSEAVEAQKVAA
jgi:hypothetical protein